MKKLLWIPLSMTALSLMLAGCGESAAPKIEATTQAAESPAAPAPADNVEIKLPDATGSGDTTLPGSANERIQVSEVTMELNIKPADTKDIVEKLKQYANEHGGYVSALETSLYDLDDEEEMTSETESDSSSKKVTMETESTSEDDTYDSYYSSYYDDYYSYYNYQWTTMSIVIPIEKSDALVKQLSSDYEVADQSESMTDYTSEYRSLLDKVAMLEDEEQRLISMLGDARSSGKARSSDSDSDYLEKVIQLENNLWETRNELNKCRFGDNSSYSYYYSQGIDGLNDYEDMKGMSIISLNIYVDKKK